MSGIEQLRQRVIAQVEESLELDNGYRFVFASDPGIKSDLVEFMEYEAKCCTFLDFVLEEKPPRLVCEGNNLYPVLRLIT